MPLEYQITGQDGQEQKVTVDNLVQQLQSNGEQVLSVSPDGSSITLQDSRGVFEKPTADIIGKLGWQVGGVMPKDPDYSSANSDTRAAIMALPDDNLRMMYLKKVAQNSGVEQPNILGKGRDWYMFNPQTNKYMALTNTPDFDKQDGMEAMTKIPSFLGGMVGGGLGSALGPAGAAGGAALGGAMGDIPTKAYLASRDPALKEVMGGNMGAMAKDQAFDATLNAVTGGVGAKVGGIFKAGPLSSALKGGGQFAESSGALLSPLANKTASSPFGKEIAGSLMPVGMESLATGFGAQLPAMGIRGAAKGVGAAGRNSFVKGMFPEAADDMRAISMNLLRKAPGQPGTSGRVTEMAEEGARMLGGQGRSFARHNKSDSVEDILGNLGGMFGGGKAYNKAFLTKWRELRAEGIPAEEAVSMVRRAIKRPAESIPYANAGRQIGRFVQNVENVGQGLESIGRGLGGAALKTAGYGGKGLQGAGLAAKTAGTLAQPIEAKTAMRYGAEEFLNPYFEERPWQDPRKSDSIYAYQPKP